VERDADFAGLAFGIERTGHFECPGIERNDGVDLGALLVVGGDAREAELGGLFRRQGACGEGPVEIGDRGRGELGAVGAGELRGGEDDEKSEPEHGSGHGEGSTPAAAGRTPMGE